MASLLENVVPMLLLALSFLSTIASYSDSSLLDFTGYMIGTRSTKVPGKVTRIIAPEYCEENVKIPSGELHIKKTSKSLLIELFSSEKNIRVENENEKNYYLVSYSNMTCEVLQEPQLTSIVVRMPEGYLNTTTANGETIEECVGYCSKLDEYVDYCKEVVQKEVSELLNISQEFCRYS